MALRLWKTKEFVGQRGCPKTGRSFRPASVNVEKKSLSASRLMILLSFVFFHGGSSSHALERLGSEPAIDILNGVEDFPSFRRIGVEIKLRGTSDCLPTTMLVLIVDSPYDRAVFPGKKRLGE